MFAILPDMSTGTLPNSSVFLSFESFVFEICRVGIEHTEGETPNAYAVATFVKTAPKEEEKPAPVPEEESSSDSD
jgi:hypothetical protein